MNRTMRPYMKIVKDPKGIQKFLTQNPRWFHNGIHESIIYIPVHKPDLNTDSGCHLPTTTRS